MARRKIVPDEQVLDTLLGTLLESGPDGLTFTRAAKACGLSPATLVQRYGNREAMVQAILLRAWDRLDAATEAADMEEPATPEGAINVLIRLMPSETAERDATDGLLLLREDIRNAALRTRGAAWAVVSPKSSAVAYRRTGSEAIASVGRWRASGKVRIRGGPSHATRRRNRQSDGFWRSGLEG